MIRKILVALDGSEPSQHALNYAVDFAVRWGAELTMLAVVERVMFPIFTEEGFGAIDFGKYQERMRTLYQKVLREAEEKASLSTPS